MLRKSYILTLASLLGSACLYAQEPVVEARIPGLENNEEYMSLLRRDAVLQFREDSVLNIINTKRAALRKDPSLAKSYTGEILQLESSIFDIRNAKGKLIDKINTIEQEWVFASLDAGVQVETVQPQENIVTTPDSLKVRNLVDNLYFKEHLQPADYEALQKAQHKEMEAVDVVNNIFMNYNTLSELVETYNAAATQEEAVEIQNRFHSLDSLNTTLAHSLSEMWNYVYDNKSYAYGYILDELSHDELLTQQEDEMQSAMRKASSLQGQTLSDEVVDYFVRKKQLVGYEKKVADLLKFQQAADSLKGVESQLSAVNYNLPRLEIKERNFIIYDSLEITRTPRYNYQNPIPECKVYPRGTIYRILLGTYNTKRAVSTFRGAYPLSYLVNENKKWCYYTAGFATYQEAEEAQAVLKKHGFLRPEIVMWRDGEMTNISRDGNETPIAYRVEIAGTSTLSDEMKNIIDELASSYDMTRVGQNLFVIGNFTDGAEADKLAAALQEVASDLEIKVKEVAN